MSEQKEWKAITDPIFTDEVEGKVEAVFSVFNSAIFALICIKISEDKFILPVISLPEIIGSLLSIWFILSALMLKLFPNLFNPLN